MLRERPDSANHLETPVEIIIGVLLFIIIIIIIERTLDEFKYDSDNYIPHQTIRITVNIGDQG